MMFLWVKHSLKLPNLIIDYMEEYLKDRAKSKAIATYTFKSISNEGQDTIPIKKLKPAI